ncbi:MAG TPA: cyanophycin synthetase [Solirubrobacterales bacterium]|nr:cyanophycin synthetase [Solirubrobacterales bacterium]
MTRSARSSTPTRRSWKSWADSPIAEPSPEEILSAREPIGWRLGPQRIWRLCTLLGMPQHRFASIHVVGTNGKTSVARMTMALLEAQGVSAGAYVSPHITSWRERILIHGEPISKEAFARAVKRAEEAAQVADRSAGEEGPVTQFELDTAAAFLAFAGARVRWAVIEAGLGGRLDATNVIPSRVTVLTSVGLDHTEWLGETVEEIAAEKLAVLRDHTTLITGPMPPEAEPVIEREVRRRHAARIGVAEAESFRNVNSMLALSAVQAALGEVDSQNLNLLYGLTIPGRSQLVEGDPDVIYDAAHNPDGARALGRILPELSGGREIVCCIAILAEKDARSIIGALAPVCAAFVCTQIPEEAIRGSGRPVGASHSAGDLAEVCRNAGAETEAAADPLEAWARARELARGRDGVALAAGSHYLLSCIWTERPAQSS